MIITQISEASKSRCRIYIDGQFAFALYKGELRKFHLKEGQEFPPDHYREITEEVLPKRAKLRCMNLLQSRDYTRKQLEDKLLQGEYPQECIEAAIAYVESYGYLDDLRYAKDFIEYHIDSRSRGRMEMDLMRKGIGRDLIRQAFEELDELGVEQDEAAMGKAIQMDVMLHAYMFMQSGIPVLYSGDEIGQVNDYTYKEDPDKAPDSRYIHRGAMNWELAGNISKKGTVEEKIFHRLERLEQIRKKEKVFVSNADTWTIDTWDASVLCIARCLEGEKIIGLFNFSEFDKTAWINETDGDYVELISGEEMKPIGVNIPAYGFYYLKRK